MEILSLITLALLVIVIIFFGVVVDRTENRDYKKWASVFLIITTFVFLSYLALTLNYAFQQRKVLEYQKHMIEQKVGIFQMNEKTLEPEFVLLPEKK